MKNKDKNERIRFNGITLLAAICFLYSLLQIYAGIQTKLNAAPTGKLALSPIYFYVIALYLACGIGLLKMEIWARHLFIFLSSYKFVEFLPVLKPYSMLIIKPGGYGFFEKTYNSLGALALVLMKIAVPVIFIYYLTRPKVKEQFFTV